MPRYDIGVRTNKGRMQVFSINAGSAAEAKAKLRKRLYADNPSRGKYVRERKADPTLFDHRSFRTKTVNDHRVVVACPKGKWNARTGRCTVGMRAQTLLHPMKKGVKRNPAEYTIGRGPTERRISAAQKRRMAWNPRSKRITAEYAIQQAFLYARDGLTGGAEEWLQMAVRRGASPSKVAGVKRSITTAREKRKIRQSWEREAVHKNPAELDPVNGGAAFEQDWQAFEEGAIYKIAARYDSFKPQYAKSQTEMTRTFREFSKKYPQERIDVVDMRAPRHVMENPPRGIEFLD